MLRAYYHRTQTPTDTPGRAVPVRAPRRDAAQAEPLVPAPRPPRRPGPRRGLRAQAVHRAIRPDWPSPSWRPTSTSTSWHPGRRASRRCAGRWPTRIPWPSRRELRSAFRGRAGEHLPDPRPGVAEFRRVLRPARDPDLTTPEPARSRTSWTASERPYSHRPPERAVLRRGPRAAAGRGLRGLQRDRPAPELCQLALAAAQAGTASNAAGTGPGPAPYARAVARGHWPALRRDLCSLARRSRHPEGRPSWGVGPKDLMTRSFASLG